MGAQSAGIKTDIFMRYERARKYAAAKGLGREAEDFAGWLVLRWVEGKSINQYITESFIDYLRETRGDIRVAVSGKAPKTPLEQLPASMPSQELDNEQKFKKLLDEATNVLKRHDRALFVLKNLWGLSGREIAHVFGVDEANISRRLNRINAILARFYR